MKKLIALSLGVLCLNAMAHIPYARMVSGTLITDINSNYEKIVSIRDWSHDKTYNVINIDEVNFSCMYGTYEVMPQENNESDVELVLVAECQTYVGL